MRKIIFKIYFAAAIAVIVWFAAFGAVHFFAVGAQQRNPAQQQQQQRPRTAAAVTPTPPPTTIKPKPSVSPSPNDEDEPIVIQTDNVILNVRVVDRNGRIVNDVKPNEFKVFEDGIEQRIESISKEEVPVNYGLVVDNSGSIRTQLEKVIEASHTMIAANKPDDASFVIRFTSSDKIEILQDFTKNKQDLNDAIDNMFPEPGQTAILDAVMLGAERASQYEKEKRREDKSRRALVLITDGEDRDSYYKEEEVFRNLRESDVQIYVIGFVNELPKDDGGFIKKSSRDKAIKLLNRLAEETGGKAYYPNSVSELPDIARQISNELRTQYIISYAPTNTAKDGKFHSIKVTITEDTKRGHRIAVTRTGRTAPKQ
jgi:Ca-activated chloride channel family protein